MVDVDNIVKPLQTVFGSIWIILSVRLSKCLVSVSFLKGCTDADKTLYRCKDVHGGGCIYIYKGDNLVVWDRKERGSICELI